MMYLRIQLLSDTAFGRGDGVAGLVDNEVEHDATTGLPIVKGRTIKGLMVEACADLLFGLQYSGASTYPFFEETARRLFGTPGAGLESAGNLHFHQATLPGQFVAEVQSSNYSPDVVRSALTTIRRQTAVDAATETPKQETLRATRVVLRTTVFHAPVSYEKDLSTTDCALVAACANVMRQGGLNRNRGLGRLQVTLEDALDTDHEQHVAEFARLISEGID